MGIFKITSRYAVILGLVALICTAISSGIFFLTKEKIDETMAAQQRERLLEVIPHDYLIIILWKVRSFQRMKI
ncbi:electron transport complex protein RnfG [Rodentibacter pneumotropicus]|uniref:Electron transport complex protein RnfG n=1 Tax=Rodentibacter pneumotropicus TaxID=758 RepID=A0A448MQ98_9PAST|nr:electron transport complex protein RnfG [Rodentibacter pneumotropicus]